MEVKNVNNKVSFRIYLAWSAFILFSIIATGIYIFLAHYSYHAAGFTLSYIAGLSTIFLPCTLLLAFIMVSIALNGNPKKALAMALYFGTGIIITFSIYGIAISYAGITSLLAENITAVIAGGGLTYILGLSELGLIRIKIPVLSSALPAFILKQKECLKMFLLGLLLANIGIFCTNPIFYVLLWDITDMSNVFAGGAIMAVHGIGRVTPLVFLAMLGILGINTICGIKERFSSIKKAAGWGLVVTGTLLLTISGPFMIWYHQTPFHEAWDDTLITLTDGRIGEVETLSPEIHGVLEAVPQWFVPYAFILLLAIPLFLHCYSFIQKRKS